MARELIPELHYPFSGKYPITFPFGAQPDSEVLKQKFREWGLVGHNGIDFGLPEGTTVLASAGGVVKLAGANGDFGISVLLQHDWGTSLYAHLKSVLSRIGSTVNQEDRIGLSDATGFALGPHLHFAIKPRIPNVSNGYLGYINPAPYLVSPQEQKLESLKQKLAYYEGKLAFKMKRYRGVIHESGVSEMKHAEVMVLRAMVSDLKREINELEKEL